MRGLASKMLVNQANAFKRRFLHSSILPLIYLFVFLHLRDQFPM